MADRGREPPPTLGAPRRQRYPSDVPDDFPALEAVAALAFAAGLLRALSLRSALRQLPDVTRELEGALGKGEHERARELALTIESATFAPLASALIDRVRADSSEAELRAVFEAESRRVKRQGRRALASGGLSGLLLFGLLLFAIAARLGIGSGSAPGAVFNALVIAGVMTALANVIVGFALHRSTRSAAEKLLFAALAGAARKKQNPASSPCPECGKSTLVPLELSTSAAGGELGPAKLLACSSCGAVSGRLLEPERLLSKPVRRAEPPPEGPEPPSSPGGTPR